MIRDSVSNSEEISSIRRLTRYNSMRSDIANNPIRMVHENIDLRNQLKILNQKLNELLTAKVHAKKTKIKHGSPENILRMAKKQIDHYK